MELTSRARGATVNENASSLGDDAERESFLGSSGGADNSRKMSIDATGVVGIVKCLLAGALCGSCGCARRFTLCCRVFKIVSGIFVLFLLFNFHAWALYMGVISDTPVKYAAHVVLHDTATCDMTIPPAVEKTVHVVEDINAACVNVDAVDAGMCFESQHSRVRCLPTFVIIGFEKCSTTQLMMWFAFHPNLKTRNNGLFPTEARYFESSALATSENLRSTWRNYVEQFPSFPKSAAGQYYTFEKTPALAQSAKAARLLHELMPSSKLVVMVRNPTSRAYSHFQMYCKMDRIIRDDAGKISYIHKNQVKECKNNDDCEVMTYPCKPSLFEEYVKSELSIDPSKDYSAASPHLKAVPNAIDADNSVHQSRILNEGIFYMHLMKWFDVGFKLDDFVIGTSETFWKNNTLVSMAHMQKALDVPVYDFSRVAVLEENEYKLKSVVTDMADQFFYNSGFYDRMTKQAQNILDAYYCENNRKFQEFFKGKVTIDYPCAGN